MSCNVWLCMNEMSDLLNSFFIWIYFIPLSSFLVLTNAKCKCHPLSHADECPKRPYKCNMEPLCPDMSLINFELLTLMSIFLWMQTKCDASLNFCLWYKCFLTKMQMQFSWCRCLMQGWRCKVYSWWCQCTYSNHDAIVFLQR